MQHYFTIMQSHSKIKKIWFLMLSETLETALKLFVIISDKQNFEPKK